MIETQMYTYQQIMRNLEILVKRHAPKK